MKKKRSAGNKAETKLVVGVGWYSPEQYARLREVAVDPKNIHVRWVAWAAKAEEMNELLRTRGLVVQRIDVDVDELMAWCASEGKPIDGASRAAFISMKCRELGMAMAKSV
jgi:hypothetical protein